MNLLEQIINVKKEEVTFLRKKYTYKNFEDNDRFHKPSLSFEESIKKVNKLAIIAEIKKASPSKGIISKDFEPLKIAESYQSNGVNAISVLTDKKFFEGDINYLNFISEIKLVPLLRKDFIIDEIQLYEAKANGADAVLLICEVLEKNQIYHLTQSANEIDLQVLLELHSVDQIDKIDFNLNKIIGINNRNLTDFSVDIQTSINIISLLPGEILKVSESGIDSKDSIQLLKKNGFNAVLIGEYLMRSESIKEKLITLNDWCSSEN